MPHYIPRLPDTSTHPKQPLGCKTKLDQTILGSHKPLGPMNKLASIVQVLSTTFVWSCGAPSKLGVVGGLGGAMRVVWGVVRAHHAWFARTHQPCGVFAVFSPALFDSSNLCLKTRQKKYHV